MKALFDHFQHQVGGGFRDFLLATAYLELGQQAIDASPPQSSIQLTVGPGINTEPMNLRELLPRRVVVKHGVAEAYQSKAVAAWADLLNGVFRNLISDHLGGVRGVPELGNRQARLNFASDQSLISQIQTSLENEFAFSSYTDRIRLITKVLDPQNVDSAEYSFIRKHVLIRNAGQHHQGLVYQDMLRDLGARTVEVLAPDSTPMSLTQGALIELHAPEIDKLKSVFFVVTSRWRESIANVAA